VDIPIYAAGLKLYDALARDSNLPTSRILSRAEVCHLAPGIASHDIVGRSLKGGIQYFDGQFDDARFAISLMQSAFSQGATLLNYVPCTGFLKTDGNISGVLAKDAETGEDFQIRGRMVVNATGVFVDALRSMDNPGQAPVVSPSQGVHIVVDRKFMPGDQAILIPKTPDGRVLFCIPWLGKILIGTTDTPRNETRFDPEPLEAEIDYLLSTAGQALAAKPVRADIRARFAGLRPLISSGAAIPTSQLSREHIILVSPSRLITITGGKWTTYRKMAEEVIDASLRVAGLRHIPSKTATLPLAMPTYAPDYGEPLHPDFPYDTSVVSNAFRYELARQPDDILFRRTRIGFLDECAANAVRPRVESLLAAARTASAEVTPAIQKQARE
jgi:glycerol-3-phosphate dehydrogenase